MLKRAGLRDIRFHDLRHTYASLMVAAGVDPKTLQYQMGHSSIKITMDRYAHLFKTNHHDAAEKMSTFLDLGNKMETFSKESPCLEV